VLCLSIVQNSFWICRFLDFVSHLIFYREYCNIVQNISSLAKSTYSEILRAYRRSLEQSGICYCAIKFADSRLSQRFAVDIEYVFS
jgi:hypothetical protein